MDSKHEQPHNASGDHHEESIRAGEPSAAGPDWGALLVDVAHRRNKATFMTFYEHFAPRLLAWLVRRCGEPAIAEELVQETMLTAWRKAAAYDPHKAAAGTWLFCIARNLHLDHCRRQRSRPARNAGLSQPLPSHDRAPEAESLPLDGQRLRQAIRALPPGQAQVIYKCYFEGKTHQQIAIELEMPLGSVKSSLRLAFAKLTHLLGVKP